MLLNTLWNIRRRWKTESGDRKREACDAELQATEYRICSVWHSSCNIRLVPHSLHNERAIFLEFDILKGYHNTGFFLSIADPKSMQLVFHIRNLVREVMARFDYFCSSLFEQHLRNLGTLRSHSISRFTQTSQFSHLVYKSPPRRRAFALLWVTEVVWFEQMAW